MRDIVIVGLVLWGSLIALRRPWVGVMVWTWISIMNPHRFSWGFAYDAPLAAVAAGTTLLGLVFTRDRESPFKGSPVTWLLLFMLWVTLSWGLGLDPEGDYAQWTKVMKIDVMIMVALALLHSKQHVLALAWVSAGSLAILGVKGGIFTIANGGNYRVWGPPGSFIGDNNEFALALVMTIPLLRMLQMQMAAGWRRHGMTLAMLLCAASAFGSQSRGALLAITSMTVVMWWRGRSRVVGGIFMLLVGISLVAFMPDTWSDRMSTIKTYEEDRSAMGRISAWWTAWGIATTRPLGVGFDAARPELVAMHSPYPDYVHAAHSIYFQVLGNHGFIGLFLFLGFFGSTYLAASRLRKLGMVHPEAAWCEPVGAMCQVSLIGYAVGGAFLSLSYFDLPYNIMVMVVVGNCWVHARGWEKEPPMSRFWSRVYGLPWQPAKP
jgi:putative inorganic carbon (hco3(-)) transporter